MFLSIENTDYLRRRSREPRREEMHSSGSWLFLPSTQNAVEKIRC
jgi:hypothetical protein